jgi:protein-tyrosine-phosphatase/predicted ATP-grasp superfamily ATP-dependent carboligase
MYENRKDNSGATGNVLVLGHGVRAFLAVIRSLGRTGLTVHVGMCPSNDLALRSRYVHRYHKIPIYRPGQGDWLEAMTAICMETQFDLVIPCEDQCLIPIQLHREDLSRLTRVYSLGERAFRVAFDKIASTQLAAELGVPVPRQKIVDTTESVDVVLEGMTLPVVVKPPSSFAAEELSAKRKVFRARTAEQLREILTSCNGWGKVQVQENFIGTGAGVEVLAHRGNLLVVFQHLRIHEPLEGGGSSYRRSVRLHPALLDATRRLLMALDYTGVAMVEFKINSISGKWIFIEINGRFWGSIPLAIAAGVDFPRYLYEMLIQGRHDFPSGYRVGVSSRNLFPDLRWLAANIKADRSDPVIQTRLLWKVALEPLNALLLREHIDALTIDDIGPGMGELSEIFHTVMGKVSSTVRQRVRLLPPLRRRSVEQALTAVCRGKSILFVCKGNICRSPFAERYARSILSDSLSIHSSGYFPVSGRPAPEDAITAAAEQHVDLSDHRSQRLDSETVRNADVIFVFDEQNRRRLVENFPQAIRKVHMLGSLLQNAPDIIDDPYSGDLATFRITYSRIAKAIDRLVER